MNTTIIFDHRNRIGKDGTGHLEVRVSVDRTHSYYINTGVRVIRQNFVGGSIVNQADAVELNERLTIIYKKVQEEVNRCLEAGREIDVADIRRKVWDFCDASDEESTSLLDFIEEQEPLMNLREGTLKRYRTLRGRLAEWGQMLRMSDCTPENVCKFDAWLHELKCRQSDAEKKAKAPVRFVSDTAVFNYHRCLKAILNRAVLFGKIDRNPYDLLRGKFKRGDKDAVEFLTDEEMEAIESLHPMKGSAMATARDLFVFQMHTGLAYADTQKFDFSRYEEMDGQWVCIGQRVKTGVSFVTVLDDECVAILDKYNGQLPVMNNADYNKCLKALGMAAGIEKRLHSHMARHSFATHMLRNGARIENVSKMLGHTNITQTQRYAKVLAKSVIEDFKKAKKKP